MELFSKNTDIRELRCAYWTLCELTLLNEDIHFEAELQNAFEELNDAISRSEYYIFPKGVASDVHNQGTSKTDWVQCVITQRYSQIILPNKGVTWLNQLDQRGLHWVYAQTIQLMEVPILKFKIDLCLDVDKVIRALDYHLYFYKSSMFKSSGFLNKSTYTSNLKLLWEEYFNKIEKFDWLTSDLFNVFEWGYFYLKKSNYESFPSYVLNSDQYEDYLLLSFDLIIHQPKGALLQKAFLKDFRSAFRVQKNRAEKEAKNLSTRSYDFPQETIDKLDLLSKNMNRTKTSIIIDAIDILASKTEKDNEKK